ncbi:MAG: hypothetical protein HY553_07780 [Elusimicrobia bacterium]|nr:hypothetical protein [Elusimicrobiota bacterium]
MLNGLDRRILTSCVDRYVGLSFVLSQIAEESKDSAPLALRAKAIAVLGQLLKDGLIRAGRPTPDGKAFVAWSLEAKDSLQRIEQEWTATGRPAVSADFVWFAATKQGARVCAGPA